MIGNTNGIYIPQGGNKTYIDLVPLIKKIQMIYNSDIELNNGYYLLEQHFWYSGNCNLEDYMEIKFNNENNYNSNDSLKFKYKYLIPTSLGTGKYQYYGNNSDHSENFYSFLFNNTDEQYYKDIIDTVLLRSDNSTSFYPGVDSTTVTLTSPSQITGILILRCCTHKNYSYSTKAAEEGEYNIPIKVTKGSTEVTVIPSADFIITNDSNKYFIASVIVQNVYD